MKSSILAVALGFILVLLSISYLRAFHNTVAQFVLGQVDLTHNTLNLTDDQGLLTPSGVAVDASGNLYVSDFFNSRVLVYFTPLSDQVADVVLGQHI